MPQCIRTADDAVIRPKQHAALRGALALTGACGIIAQLLLLRELLSLFSGNELSIGIVLSNWLALEAGGAALFSVLFKRAGGAAFRVTQLLFAAAVCLGLWQARTLFPALGYVTGETPGLAALWLATLPVLAPSALLHGALFTASVRVLGEYCGPDEAASSAYIWDSLGSIAGAAAFTWLFIPLLTPFACAALTAAFSALSNVALDLAQGRKLSAISTGACLAALLALPFTAHMERATLDTRFAGFKVLEHVQSPYGSVTALARQDQISILQDGEPAITSPAYDFENTEEFTQCALLAHPSPRKLFILGGGAGGIITEALKHAGLEIKYAELNPALPAMALRHPTVITAAEFSSPSVSVETEDGRKFLSENAETYDIILLGQASPSTLQANRVYTREFFRLARKRLNAGGILALSIEGSESYLPDGLARLNLSILSTLKEVFPSVIVFGGDRNIYLALDKPGVNLSARDLAQRTKRLGGAPGLMTPGHILMRFAPEKTARLMSVLETLPPEMPNSDVRPRAVILALTHWSEEFAPRTARLLNRWADLSPQKTAISFTLALTALWLALRRMRAGRTTGSATGMATTGAAAMFHSLTMMFLCQSTLGYIYLMAGLFIAALTAGGAAGSMLARKNGADNPSNGDFISLAVTASIAVFIVSAPHLPGGALTASAIILNSAAGFAAGWQFQACCAHSPEAAGGIYALDLLGGWLGGTAGAVLLLPAFGAMWSCAIIAIMKLFSLAVTMGAYDKKV